jgi:competence protein ComEC
MKRLLNYLPFHFVVLLFLGIYTQFYHQFWKFGFLELRILIVTISLFLLLLKLKKITTLLSFILFFLIGLSAVYFNNDAQYKNYYQNYAGENTAIIIRVDKTLKSGLFNDKYEVEVVQVDRIKTRGKVLLNVQKDSFVRRLKVDDLLHLKPSFQELNAPLNPHQFNYKNYLVKQGIHQQLFLKKHQIKKIELEGSSMLGIAAKFRNYVQESLKRHHFKPDELSVINALLLGQRQAISKQLIADYSKAGAIHILAVSGLHVGIILLILNWVFKPIERLKKGKFIKTVIVILFLWMFAFVAGLSASVVRAVTMFTFLAIGLSFQRKNVVEFSLIASMFFLLIIKPMFLFDVGFQLSYLAVFGIIWVQPTLYKFWTPKLKIVNKFWQLFTVSIAAQAGILPLSLFYFHQFPGLFIASNLVVIPFLGAILIGGIVIILLSLINLLPQFLATIYGFVIAKMNNFVSWISDQEQFLFKDLSVSFLMMIASYLGIIFLVSFLMYRSSKKIIYFLSSIVIIQIVFMFETNQRKTEKAVIVFHKSRNSVIGIRAGEELLVYHNLDSIELKKTNAMTSYRIGENVHQYFKTQKSSIFKFENEHILLIDSLGVYQLNNLKSPSVVLRYSPKINLERLIKTMQPKQIIADGSNYKSDVNRWEIVCEKQKTPFYYTGKNGAYIIKKN